MVYCISFCSYQSYMYQEKSVVIANTIVKITSMIPESNDESFAPDYFISFWAPRDPFPAFVVVILL